MAEREGRDSGEGPGREMPSWDDLVGDDGDDEETWAPCEASDVAGLEGRSAKVTALRTPAVLLEVRIGRAGRPGHEGEVVTDSLGPA